MTVNGTEVGFIWKESSGYPVEQFSLYYLILDFGVVLFIIVVIDIVIFSIRHFMRGVYAS